MELQKTLYECYRWRANWGELVMARQRIELAPEEAEELSPAIGTNARSVNRPNYSYNKPRARSASIS
jgi:hypothetical protein